MIDKSSPEWAEKCKAFLEELTELSRRRGIEIQPGPFDGMGLEPLASTTGRYVADSDDPDEWITWEEGQ